MVWNENSVSHEILGCALEVHRALGPGLLESAYQRCLEREFLHAGLAFESQKCLGLTYRDEFLPDVYRLDFVVEGLVIVEVKSVLRWEPVFSAQVMTYLKLTDLRLGLLLNFHVPRFRDGIRRIVRGLEDPLFGGTGERDTPRGDEEAKEE